MKTINKKFFKDKTALIVVPEPIMSDIIASTLLGIGISDLYKVSSGEDALSNLDNFHVDIIISDYELPNISGTELLKNVRTNPLTATMPFIIVSANIDHKDVAYAISLGVSDYLVKPFTAKILEEKLYHALSKPVKKMSSAQTRGNVARAQAQKKQPTILIVDDIIDNFKIISTILREDYKIKAANNSIKALKICESDSPPDLILLDIMMPGMDGLELCRLIKSNPFLSHISIIFTTALDQTTHIVKGLEAGAVDYITKPINAAILKARVKTHCKLIYQQIQLRSQVDIMLSNAQLREDFESLIQHDLKRPFSEMMKSINIINHRANQDKRTNFAKATLNHSTNLLSQSIDNMLTLYKIEDESYKISRSEFNLGALAKEVLLAFGMTIKEKNLDTSFVLQDYKVRGEPVLLRSATAKVLEFCINIAEPNSHIVIKLEKNREKCQLIIQLDSITSRIEKDKLLDSYQPGDDTNFDALLLYSARRMAEVQQGSLSCSWQSEQDIAFTLTFDLNESSV